VTPNITKIHQKHDELKKLWEDYLNHPTDTELAREQKAEIGRRYREAVGELAGLASGLE
jgi:hypothetical protein